MSIIQFLRILWAYRFLTALTTVATGIGAAIAVMMVPPAYDAKTRVMLNTLKPDPVTGEVLPTNASRTYITTQRELIRDYAVAGKAVDKLGWLSDPGILQGYGAVTNQDSDLRRSLAQRIIDRTTVGLVAGTNILEITFRANQPDQARMMANALRDAYIETNLNGRRQEAARNAEWYSLQAQKEKELLDKADAAKTAYERENGIVMQDEKTDVETARLRALASAGALGGVTTPPAIAAQSSPAAIQLAQLDAQIQQASKTLGPNHPSMIQMKAQRATLAKVVADDAAAAREAAGAAARAVAASAGAVRSAVEQQTSKVLANRAKIERLNQLQAQVNLHRGQMEKALARASELRLEAAVADSGIEVLSEAVTPRRPAFPNKPLIFGGSVGLGAGVGLFLSLLIELLRRKVRGVEDLQNGLDVPLMGVVRTRSLNQAPSLAGVTRALAPPWRRVKAA